MSFGGTNLAVPPQHDPLRLLPRYLRAAARICDTFPLVGRPFVFEGV